MGTLATTRNAPELTGLVKGQEHIAPQRVRDLQLETESFLSPASGITEAGLTQPASPVDFSQTPAQPGLRTSKMVQCCAKDGSSCSCPSCTEASENEESTLENQDAQGRQSMPVESGAESDTVSAEAEADTASAETAETESGVMEGPPPAGLIVDDTASELREGQMRKAEFLQQLKSEICTTIEPILAGAGQSTEGCPYLGYWFDLYQAKDAAHIERVLRRYAPDTANATTAAGYISLIAQRALQAAESWVRTGRLTGIPEGVPTTLPGEASAPGAVQAQASGGTTVQAKAKAGGARAANDPEAMQQELGQGQPLDGSVRSRMESAFGTSFDNVRTHSDSVGSGLSDRVNARAFTVGNHVAFGAGEYKPGTPMGDALIAHELAHVVQQKGGTRAVDKMETGDPGYQALERDADKTAGGVISSLWGGFKGAVNNAIPQLRSGLALQKCSRDSAEQQAQPQPANPAPARPAAAPTVDFVAANACSAFDDTIAPHAIMVKTGGTNTANAQIAPAGATSNISFESDDTAKATVSPATSSGTPQAITVTGVAKGEANILAKQTGTASVLATLRVSIKDNLPKTVEVHKITDTANTPNLVPTNAPTAASLETFLNDNIWGKQANVTVTVTRSDHRVRYDLDGNQKLADPVLESATSREIDAITAVAKTASKDFNIYYINEMEVPHAFTMRGRGETWIQDTHVNSTANVTAHELGHALGIARESQNALDVMFEVGSSTNPCEVRKRDWDDVNP